MQVKVVIQLTDVEEARALPILLRHSPGTILPERTYILDMDVVKMLSESGIRFQVLSREVELQNLAGVGPSERI